MIELGKTYSLDLGAQAPVAMRVIEVKDGKVHVKYLNSWPGRTEVFTEKEFKELALIQD